MFTFFAQLFDFGCSLDKFISSEDTSFSMLRVFMILANSIEFSLLE